MPIENQPSRSASTGLTDNTAATRSAAPTALPYQPAHSDASHPTPLRRLLDGCLSLLRRLAAQTGALLVRLIVGALDRLGVLDKTGDILIGLLVKRGKPGPLSDAQQHTVKMLKNSVYARLVVEGYLSSGRGMNRYPEWDALNAELYQEGSAVSPGTGVSDAGFLDGLEKLVGERFSSGNTVQPLINGPASFEQRYRLMGAAKESIYLATWKVYGDETGKKTVDTLLAKRQENPAMDIRVIVDGNVATRDPTSLEQLKRLVNGGVPVALYHHDQRPFDGFHYKQLVVDGASEHPISIAGGMNIGDAYSHGFGTPHADDPLRRRWRDTDVRIDGQNARDDYLSFAWLWNEQASRSNAIDPFQQTLAPIDSRVDLPAVPAFGEVRVMTTIDEPGPDSRQTVTLAKVRAIRAAQRSIDVENAYFMDVPAIRNALIDAAQRGVCVRVLTNSPDSVDETVVCVPIMKGLHGLLKHAEAAAVPSDLCQVYVRNRIHPAVRNGDTLHSKYMVIDQEFSLVTSLNIHARSLRLEVEGAHFIADKDLSEALSAQFDRDLGDARRYHTSDDIEFPHDFVSWIMRRVNLDPVLL